MKRFYSGGGGGGFYSQSFASRVVKKNTHDSFLSLFSPLSAIKPRGIQPAPNLMGWKTIRCQLKVPASKNSTCLCPCRGRQDGGGVWEVAMLIVSHPGRAAALRSDGVTARLESERRKTSRAPHNNPRMVEYWRAAGRQNTDAPNVPTLFFQAYVDEMENPPLWNHPRVWKPVCLCVGRGSTGSLSSC